MTKEKKEKKPSFTIRFVPAEGDPREVIKEIVQERIKLVLHEHNAVLYNDGKSNHTTGVIGNERKSKIIREGIDSKGVSEG